MLAFGHWGRPVLVFPSQGGDRWEWEREGMVAAVGGLLDAGRVKLYCVDSPYGAYEEWLLGHVVPVIHADCGGPTGIVATGASIGAYHAANLVLRRADVFPLALCLSGVYDLDQVAGLGGDHLDWLRAHASLQLVVGRGAWEDSTGSLEQTHRFAALLAEKGIRHELDVWGEEWPHDWPAWRSQISHHLPGFT